MHKVIVYTTEACPKCRALKVFLKDNHIKFRTEPMADSMPRLSAFNGWPPDNAAPVMEVNDDSKKDPFFYTHYDLFDRNGLKKAFILETLGADE